LIRRINTVAVVVRDKDKAVEWYRDKLGFTVRVDSGDHWVEVCLPAAETGIHLCEATGRFEPEKTGICFTVDDVRDEREELGRRGVVFTKEPWQYSPGLWFAQFRDLDGNVFVIQSSAG